MEPTAQSFGVLLKRYRARARFSQEALAERARMSVETISALERGTRRNPYRDTVALLATALALSPPERSMLESAAGRSSVPAAVRASLQPVSGPSGNLPLQLTSFVGRAGEVAAIDELLRTNRLVTLTGPGGVGKTRVALQVAAILEDRMADGAWFVELASLVDPALIPGTIAGALRCGLPAEGDPLEGLLSVLARKRLLLVLDNCEHMIAATRAVAKALLLGCPHSMLLATSRQVLGIAGEATFQIPSLSVPDAVTAAALGVCAAPDFEALTLFVDRARAAQSPFELTDGNAPIVADICRRLDGIPLAIELAATRIKILSPRDLRDRLDARFRILTGGSRDALPRQQTLRALIDWSYDLLDERERELFRRVGVFADGFTLEAATAICGDAEVDELDVLDLLASLVDKSLIFAAVAGNVTRYRLLESTRMYALEMLAASSERARLEARHLAFFCDAVASAERALERSGSDALFTALTPDLENVRAALYLAATTGAAATGGTLAVAAARLFSRLGLGAEGIGWLEAALKTADPSDLRLQSRIWSAIAHLVVNHGGGARSFEAAGHSIALARMAGDRELLAWALIRRAVAAMEMHRRADAEAALAEAAELFGPDALAYQRAHLLAVRLRAVQLVGDLPSAIEIGEELRALFRRLGNESGELMTTLNEAEDLHALGETARAVALVHEASSCSAGNREMHGILQSNLGAYLAALGEVPAARAAGAEAIELLSAGGPAGIILDTVGHLALAHALSGEAKRAARLLGYWDAAWNALDVPRGFTERTTHERLSAILAESLSPSEREALLDAGATLAPQDAIAEALRS